jgi:hypothetical protein
LHGWQKQLKPYKGKRGKTALGDSASTTWSSHCRVKVAVVFTVAMQLWFHCRQAPTSDIGWRCFHFYYNNDISYIKGYLQMQ